MGIRMERFPEHGVTLVLYSGAISAEEVRTHFTALDPADLVRRINYFDPTVDYRVDVAALAEVKRIIAAKLQQLDEGVHAAAAFVSSAGVNEQIRNFWPNFLALNEAYPGERVAFASLEEAYDWLALPDAARKAVSEAVQTQAAQT